MPDVYRTLSWRTIIATRRVSFSQAFSKDLEFRLSNRNRTDVLLSPEQRTAVFREVAGNAAIYCDPRLGESIAGACAEIMSPGRRSDLVEAGFENVKRFSWDVTADQIARIYEKLAIK